MNTIRTRHGLRLALAALLLLALGPNACKSSKDDGETTNPVASPCTSDKDCRAQDLLCDTSRRICVECLTADHCGDAQICLNSTCTDVTPCANSRDCPDDQVCSSLLRRCVECVADVDCAEGQICAGEQCRPACNSDKDCQEFDLLCATELGYCVDCSAQTDCGEDQYCSAVGTCVRDVCAPETKRCEDDQLLTCNDLGSGYAAVSCSGGCVEDGDEPRCEQGDGEGGQPGTPAGSAGASGAVAEGGSPSPPAEGGAGNSDPGTTGGVPAGGAGAGAGGTTSTGGGASGGSPATGGSSAGGTGAGGAGTGGSTGLEPSALPCALFSTCPSCCVSVGVFAIDLEGNDYTSEYVTSWNPSASSASATFSFRSAGDVGVIYFGLASLMTFSDVVITRSLSGGSLEMALARDAGATGCVYVHDGVGWLNDGCWGTGTTSSWDQVEVRVRAAGPGTASLTVTNVAYE
jgi:hypothetical protein